MLAKRLESILAEEVMKTDLSQRVADNIVERFERLRGYRLLPTGRTKNVAHLSPAEISAAILSLVTVQPGYAGLAAKVLTELKPVGGPAASFQQRASFGKAIECILLNSSALRSILEVRVSDSEMHTNAYGRAEIIYQSDVGVVTAYYVGKNSISLLAPGAEKTFDPRSVISSVVTETIFYPSLFQRLARELAREASRPPIVLSVDPKDEDEETQKEERAKRLGLAPNSRFLNVGVDNQVTWPRDETVVNFEGKNLILFPKTRDDTTSIHIDLVGQHIKSEDAITLFNRFLSLLTWCDDQFAVLQDGWSGNPVPVPVRKRNLGFITSYDWLFDRKSPKSIEARKALAIYREGRNAEQNYLISYAVLCYYKIVELKYRGKSETRTWFRNNYSILRGDEHFSDEIEAFEKARNGEQPHDYLYRACRIAVAHANKPYSSDPDDLHELRRLHVAARVLRALARQFIRNELGVSDSPYDGS